MKLCRKLILLFVLFAVTLVGCASLPECEINTEYKRDLYALVDDSLPEGHFFVYSGFYGIEHVYRFIEVTEDGGKFSREIPVTQGLLYEHEGDEAWVVKKNAHISMEHCFPRNSVEPDIEGVGLRSWYEIHIPKGTITTDKKIDLK